jgi:mono/diheme cytochrome c family protein
MLSEGNPQSAARNAKPIRGLKLKTAALLTLLSWAIGGFAAAAENTPSPAKEVTFNKHIAPIVFGQCATCHRPGEVAPFSLLTYQDVKKRAEQIRDVTASRYMPPWKSVPGHGKFVAERRLSDEQLSQIDRWFRGGMPEGDAADLPPTPKFAEGWLLGKPDLVISMPEAYHVPADGNDIYRNFVIPAPQLAGKLIKAIEFHPGNRRVVHHAVLATDLTGGARKLDAEDPGLGFTRFNVPGQLLPGGLAIWVPGIDPPTLPSGFSMPWPKNADFIVQLHLHPSGKPETEQSNIGFYFTDEPPQRSMIDLVLIQKKIDIPPGEKAYQTHDELTLPVDMRAYGIFPHMHLLGKEVKITATAPDGTVTPLLWIDDWDFNWQSLYQYAEPVLLVSGTKIAMQCIHDNSADNPRNPSTPPRRVTWGEQTTDEMSVAIVQLVPEQEGNIAGLLPIRSRIIGAIVAGQGGIEALYKQLSSAAKNAKDGDAAARLLAQQGIKQLDRNGDNLLDVDELTGFRGTPRDKIELFIARFDADKDGKLNEKELTAGVQSFGSGAGGKKPADPSDESKPNR